MIRNDNNIEQNEATNLLDIFFHHASLLQLNDQMKHTFLYKNSFLVPAFFFSSSSSSWFIFKQLIHCFLVYL